MRDSDPAGDADHTDYPRPGTAPPPGPGRLGALENSIRPHIDIRPTSRSGRALTCLCPTSLDERP